MQIRLNQKLTGGFSPDDLVASLIKVEQGIEHLFASRSSPAGSIVHSVGQANTRRNIRNISYAMKNTQDSIGLAQNAKNTLVSSKNILLTLITLLSSMSLESPIEEIYSTRVKLKRLLEEFDTGFIQLSLGSNQIIDFNGVQKGHESFSMSLELGIDKIHLTRLTALQEGVGSLNQALDLLSKELNSVENIHKRLNKLLQSLSDLHVGCASADAKSSLVESSIESFRTCKAFWYGEPYFEDSVH